MPRNYDEMRDAEDRSFVIRGERFEIIRARPELLGELEEAEKNLNFENWKDLADFSETRIRRLIDDQNGALERWDALRARDQDPITYGEMLDISRWAIELVTGLPTMPPAPSAPGRGKTEGSSKAVSR